MTDRETADLTWAMARSGEMVDLSSIPGVKVDKHSTGGVADTTTLIVAPMAAACGLPVAKMSGRGLGHTGGTVDKLESIPGVRADLSTEQFLALARKTSLAVVGQSSQLAPADKQLYALRDVTATVDSIALIASSIMSKKLCAGCDAIVLDVKFGGGAFMADAPQAQALARAMVALGNLAGRETVALITDMNQPLGHAVGNALEVAEALEVLQGRQADSRLLALCYALGSQMLLLGGAAHDEAQAREKLRAALESGRAYEKLMQMLAALGAQETFLRHPDRLVNVRLCREVVSQRAGYIAAMDTKELGRAAQTLGAGRVRKNDAIDPMVGYVLHKELGDRVEKGEPLATLYVNDETKWKIARDKIVQAVQVAQEPFTPGPLIFSIVTKEGIA
ncbi:MAG: thymidine phosphorylase, partial [Eubacteriales bacterium]|nr:thymidine phosphorylase [Eubacteriales bacterium]